MKKKLAIILVAAFCLLTVMPYTQAAIPYKQIRNLPPGIPVTFLLSGCPEDDANWFAFVFLKSYGFTDITITHYYNEQPNIVNYISIGGGLSGSQSTTTITYWAVVTAITPR